LRIGETVEEILKGDLALEMEAIPALKSSIAHCESVNDYVTRELLAEILKSEEEHVDFIETQLGLIGKMGLQNYVQLQTPSAD
jgi:bacterioferritin